MFPRSRALPLALFLFTACASAPSTTTNAKVDSFDAPVLRLAEPAEAGMSATRLDQAVQLFDDAVKEDRVVGYQLLVAHDGKIVLDRAGGVRDRESGAPMTTDSLLNMASMAKSVTAVGVLHLVDEGRLSLDDHVARYIPAFDTEKSRAITIRQLLLHTPGYTSFELFPDGITPHSAEEPDAPSLIVEARELGRRGPDTEPGTHFRYNNLGYNVLGAVIETISGLRLDEYLRRTIYEPLGMNDTVHDNVELDETRLASQYWLHDGEWEKLETLDVPFARGNGGIVSTAHDFARFCQMLLNGGTYAGHRILEPETVRLATSPLIEVDAAYLPVAIEKEMGLESEWYEYRDRRSLNLDLHRGLGFVVSGDGSYSHAGVYGTYFLVDPARQLVILVLTQSIYGGNPGQAFIETVHQAVLEGSTGRVAPGRSSGSDP